MLVRHSLFLTIPFLAAQLAAFQKVNPPSGAAQAAAVQSGAVQAAPSQQNCSSTPSSTSSSPTAASSTPAWMACDLAFELTAQDSPQAELRAEFRSPRHRTLLIRAFREKGRFVLRFAPTEVGTWDYRLTSTLPRFDGQTGQITATETSALGFVRVANVHHFATEVLGITETIKPHLWMAKEIVDIKGIDRNKLEAEIAEAAALHFTHLRLTISSGDDLAEIAERVRAINAKGLTADLVLARVPFEARERERYIGDIVSRFAAFNVTWAGTPAFDEGALGAVEAKEIGTLIKKLDAYEHPRTTMASGTSAALAGDGWMNVASYGITNIDVGSVEHQLFALPALNTGIRNSHDLWNATMNGQYPASGPGLTPGTGLASGSGAYMKAWAEFMAQSRFWELEPYFDVDGGRALALDGVEYIVYVEKPGPLELTVENHSYDVAWMNPATGEMVKQKDYKGEHFTGEPPDKSHDWVLRVSREGRKEGMLKSYKFDSRRVPVQEIEQNPAKVPYEVTSPAEGEISISKPTTFSLKAKRETRGSRSLLVEWTAEVVTEGEGYRVMGTGREGTFKIPASSTRKFPAVLSVRVAFLNANGKAYTLDKAYRLVP